MSSAAAAAALLVALGSLAYPRTAEAAAYLDELDRLHGACARSAATMLSGTVTPVLARQARWVVQADREAVIAFRLLRAATPPRTGAVADLYAPFAAILGAGEDPEWAERFRTAEDAAEATLERYTALIAALDYGLPQWSYARGDARSTDAMLDALDQLLADALADAERVGPALRAGRASSGDLLDEPWLQSAFDGARTAYQRCVYEGIRATTAATPEPRDLAAPACVVETAIAPRASRLQSVFAESPLLAGACPAAVRAADDASRLRVEQLLDASLRRADALLGRGRAAAPRAPNGGPLDQQVLMPAELRALLVRVYTVDMYCHAEAAALYRDVMMPVLAQAQTAAIDALELELERRVVRDRLELERRRSNLENVLASAERVLAALDTAAGVRNVGRTELRNLRGGATAQRDAFQRALEALDAPGLLDDARSGTATLRERYAAERRALEEWALRHATPRSPLERSPADLAADGFPYEVQTQDRYVRNFVQPAANLANGHLGACRRLNVGATGLVQAGTQSGVCEVLPQTEPFARSSFLRVVDRTTAARCSVQPGFAEAEPILARPERPAAEIARLEARVATDAAAPRADFAAALAAVDRTIEAFNADLERANALFAEIERRLEAPPQPRVPPAASERGEPPEANAERPEAADMYEPLDYEKECLAREAARRAELRGISDVSVFIRYDEAAHSEMWRGRARPDGRSGGIVDPCQVYTCPVNVRTYEECAAQYAAEQAAARRTPSERALDWAKEKGSSVYDYIRAQRDRFYNPPGDTTAERAAESLTALLCTVGGGINFTARKFTERAFKWLLDDAGLNDGCHTEVGQRFDRALGR